MAWWNEYLLCLHQGLWILRIYKRGGFEKQKSFDDLRGESKHGILRYDFHVIKENYLIEYDGQHHFKAGGGWCSEEHVQETQKRDKLKDDYCRDKGIPLIRIPYTHVDNICLKDLKLETTKFRVI